MLTSAAEIGLSIIGLYVAFGVIFALAFAFRGVDRIDPAAEKGTTGFRLLIIPGATALWPILLRRWLQGASPPEESNAHRDLSHRQAGS